MSDCQRTPPCLKCECGPLPTTTLDLRDDINLALAVTYVQTVSLRGNTVTLHHQKRILRLIRRHCVLTQTPDILRPVHPVRPDLRRNVAYVLTQRRNVSYVLTQRRVLPTSRLPQILPLIASSSRSCSLRVASSLRPDVSRPSSPLEYSQPELIRCFLRRRSAGVWGSSTFFFTSHISHHTYHITRLTGLANS